MNIFGLFKTAASAGSFAQPSLREDYDTMAGASSGIYDALQPHQDDLLHLRDTSPPPPDVLPFATGRGCAVISNEPFDWDDGASFSSQDSDHVRRVFATRALTQHQILSSQKHPLVDCAYNIYTSQLQRACGSLPKKLSDTPAHRAAWRKALSAITPDFFWHRQNPPMVASPQLSAKLVNHLVTLGVLQSVTLGTQTGCATAAQYLTQDMLLAAQDRSNTRHPALKPPQLHMITFALNVARDAGLFSFPELQQIYGFVVLRHHKVPSPFAKVTQSTEDACKMYEDCGQVTKDMVHRRGTLVAGRKQEIEASIRSYAVAELTFGD